MFEMITLIQAIAQILGGFAEILSSPFRDPSVLWLILPLITLWLLLEVYFGKYKKAELGWNSALANGVTLFWVGASLAKFVVSIHPELFGIKMLSAVILIMYGLFIVLISFEHKLPNHIAFLLASPSAVYYPAIIATLWCYGSISFTIWNFISAIILYVIILALFWVVKKSEKATGAFPKLKKGEGLKI